VAPDSNNITVLNKGTPQGENTSIPKGGHIFPIKTTGDKLE
jgi:hypothetical protein